jgi:poly(U)-binding-splicing factor PUF60
LSSEDVKSVFEAFGKITKVDLAPNNVAGKHRGWGYINYASHKSAQDAIASMNLFDLGGQFLRVRGALTPPMQLYPPNAAPVLPTILTATMGTTDEQAAAAQQAASSMPILNTIPNVPAPAPKPEPAAKGSGVDAKNIDAIQAKLQQANEEKGAGQEVTTLQQEENVSISGSNARLMIMKKLSRKSESTVIVLRNMVDAEDLDEELEEEVTGECSKYGGVERVVIYQEKQGVEEDADTVVKIFVMFTKPAGECARCVVMEA